MKDRTYAIILRAKREVLGLQPRTIPVLRKSWKEFSLIQSVKEISLVILFGGLFIATGLVNTRGLSFRLDSDYDMILPYLAYVVDYVKITHRLPDSFPYAGVGLPIMGDPLSPVFNPFLLLPVAILGIDRGIRLIFAMVVIASGISMWMFLRSLGVSGWARWWGAIMYQISGALTARFAAGHSIFWFSYPLVPWFLRSSLPSSPRPVDTVVLALILTLMFLAGDVYGVGFMLLFLVIIRGYHFLTKSECRLTLLVNSVGTVCLFVLISAVKLVPVVLAVSTLVRFFPAQPTAGSIHSIFVPLAYMVPWREAFWDRPFFQRLFGFHFNWYEYYAFVSPLPFLFLGKLRQAWQKETFRVLAVIVALGALYVGLGYPYSPFYWLFRFIPPLSTLQAPQRLLGPLTAVVVAMLSLACHEWTVKVKSKTERYVVIAIFAASLTWTFGESQTAFRLGFEKPRVLEEKLVRQLRQRDGSSFYVVSFVCCLQKFLVAEKIPLLNYYAGMRAADTPNFLNPTGEGFNFARLYSVRPKYVIVKPDQDLSLYAYYPFMETAIARVWQTDTPNISPKSL